MSTKISIKVSLENDTRRLTLNEPSFGLLLKTLSKLFRLENNIFVNNLIQVKYKDDENDVVTISTDDEFQEAISLSYNLQPPILRLFLVHSNPKRENPPPKVHQPSPPQPKKSCGGGFIYPFWQQLKNLFNEGTKESLETARTLLLKHLSILPNHSHHLYNLACVEALLGNSEHSVDYLEKAIQAGWKDLTHMETDPDLDSIRHLDKYKDLVSSLQKSSPPPYQNRKCNGFRSSFQWHFLQQQINNHFDIGTPESFETARTLLLQQLSIVPSHPIPLYNLACVEALLGNLEHSVDYLEKAIQAGWKDLTHMETDPDLDSIRHLDKYKDLVSSLQKSPPPYQNRRCNGFRSSFQWHFLQQQINNHFDIGTPESLEVARTLLLQQLSIVPSHPIPLYNLACVEALLGKVDRALHFLEEAIHAGYKDVGHMETDKDLDGLRHLEKYKVLVASLKDPKPEKVEVPKPEKVEFPKTEKVEVPKPEKVEVLKPDKIEDPCPVPPLTHPWRDNLKTLEEMGFNDQDKNKMVLQMTQGDLTATIQTLLDLF